MAHTRTDMAGVDPEQLLLAIGRTVRARKFKAMNGDVIPYRSVIEVINLMTSTWLRDNPTVASEYERIMPAVHRGKGWH